MLESIKAVAAIEMPPRHRPRSARDEALLLRAHLLRPSGRASAASRSPTRWSRAATSSLTDDGGEVTPAGERFLDSFGVDLSPPAAAGGCSASPASTGASAAITSRAVVGAAILCRCMELGWFKRERDSRALRLTAGGRGPASPRRSACELGDDSRRRKSATPQGRRCEPECQLSGQLTRARSGLRWPPNRNRNAPP